MHKKKIAIITHGGIGTGPNGEGMPVLMNTISILAEQFDITVYSLEKICPHFSPKNYTIKATPFNANTKLSIRIVWLGFSVIINHIIRPYHLFHGYWGFPGGWLVTIVGKFLNRKIIISFLGAEVINLPEIKYGLYNSNTSKRRIEWVSKNADCIIAQSNFHAKKIQEVVAIKLLKTIYSGVDTTKFSFIEKVKKTPFQLLHVANLNEVKDQETLLRAFKIISSKINAELHIVGVDTLNGRINNLAKEMNLSDIVFFYGLLKQEEIISLYHKADIFLLTSLYESQAVVVNEAMATGTIVCGTRVGLLADLENKATLAVDVKDAAALADKVIELFNNKVLYKNLQTYGLQWSKEHDIIYTADKYISLYKSLINK